MPCTNRETTYIPFVYNKKIELYNSFVQKFPMTLHMHELWAFIVQENYNLVDMTWSPALVFFKTP